MEILMSFDREIFSNEETKFKRENFASFIVRVKSDEIFTRGLFRETLLVLRRNLLR